MYKLALTGGGLTIEKELDSETAMKIIAIVVGGAAPASTSSTEARQSRGTTRRKRSARALEEGDSRRGRRRSGGPTILKDLRLRPAGKTAFVDFAAEKAPNSHEQKQVVILFWLKHEAGLDQGITVDHVNTCYVEAKWPRPASGLEVSLRLTASKKGWIDTSDSTSLGLTPRGEDFVRQELPPRPRTKK